VNNGAIEKGDFMSRIAYVNGRYVPHADAAIHIEDRGFQFADSVYEVCAVSDSCLIDEERHFDRLKWSLGELEIGVPFSPQVLGIVYREVLRQNRLRDGIVYCQVTRGQAPREHAFPTNPPPATVVVTAKPINIGAVAARHAEGVAVVTRKDERWARCDIKSTGLLANVLAKQNARNASAFEAWLVDADGNITEGTSTNAWIVSKEGVLVTREADTHILGGVTRLALLEGARALGLIVEERPFSKLEALNAAEAFSSASTVGALPVVRIDQTQIADGKPGPITQKLNGFYHSR
jgi:D-alanine transaminase